VSELVLFVCVHNAGRSQMAAALFHELADPAKARAMSAGSDPGTRIHPEVVVVMQEIGIDLRGLLPAKLIPAVATRAALLVTMGCGDVCPVVPGVRREDWALEDPKGQSIERVREIRDQVRSHVVSLLQREGWLRE
jgi:arsenate reductase